MNTDITYFAKTDFRNEGKTFGIWQKDRLLHTYLVGKTGTGKSTMIKTMFMQDVLAGRGACILDPHSDLVESIYQSIPAHRKGDVIYFDIPNPELTLRYNPFKKVSYEKRSLVASSILDVFKKLWSDAWGVKLEHILRYSILTLLDQPSATLADIPKLLLDKTFRRNCIANVENPSVNLFWDREFPYYTRFDLLPVLNKFGGMLAHSVIKRVLVENTDEVYLRKAMDERKIILVNLSKGHVGEDVAHLLGALFISSINSAAFSRVDTDEEMRIPFMVYMDEFHNFTTQSLMGMFSELRKFKVGLILANQYLHQMDDEVRRAILGNAGTLISFRVGTEDAQILSREMYPVFKVEDFINLPNYSVFLRLMINGVPSKPFSGISIVHGADKDPP
ncbi:MAG: type IV secretion system DNA-binding domain-containing protein [Bacteroidetes bacterium]|nr:type IV secretion system DNA-binding domain-containing protein [Bacteroidota bacterium]